MAEFIEGIRRRSGPRSNRSGGVRRARGTRLAWLTLVGFILGVSLCPFNPTDRGNIGPESKKENTIMNPSMQGTAAADTSRPDARAVHGTQTATFAMG